MNRQDRTNTQLISEIESLRRRLAELEEAERSLKRTERSLRESEGRFRSLYENAPLAYQSLDENGNILEVNQEWLETLGYSREEVIGKWVGDFLTPPYREKFALYFPQFKAAGEIHGVEFEMLRQDGTRRIVSVDGRIGHDEQGRFKQTHCILHDISEIKLSRDALKESEQRYKAVVDNIEIGISVLNPKLEIVEVNKAFKKYFPQVRPGIGQICYEHYNDPPRSEPCWYCPCVLTLRDGEIHEAITETPTGTEIRNYHIVSSPIKDSDGRVLFVIELAEDITVRKKVQEELDRANREWEQTFNAISDLVMVLDNQHTILHANKAMADAVGMPEQDLIGRHCFELVHGEQKPPEYCPHSQLLADGNEHSAEVAEPLLGGIFEVCVSPLVGKDGQVTGSVHVTRNISERKRAESELQRSNDLLRAIIEAAPTAIIGLDLDGNVQTVWNPAAEKMLGWSAQEAMGQPLPSVPVERREEFGRFRELIRSGKSLDGVEVRRQRRDGSPIDYSIYASPLHDAEGQISGNIAVMVDITERKRQEEKNLLLAAIVEYSDDAIIGKNLDGMITSWNRGAEQIYGWKENEVVGKPITILVPPDRISEVYQFLERIERGEHVEHHETVRLTKDGSEIDLSLTISPIRDAEGKIVGASTVARDITEQKSLQRQLVHAQKMESIAALASGIAHDFNNLLQIVVGYADMLLFQKKPTDPEYEGLHAIRQAGRDGSELAKRILTFGRRLEPNARPVNLNNEILRLEKMLRRTVPKMIQIEILLGERLKTVNADPSQMEQVLLNLVINAQHAMPDGGRLTIETSNVVLGEQYLRTHLAVEPGEYVVMMVSDTGQGMEKEVLERIFEPFYTTKSAREGTGLGLAVVYGIVKSHGGRIICYSEPGKGTTFKIYLPAFVKEIEQDPASPPTIPAFGTETILLVDDEESVRKVGMQILRMAGYNVLTATNGREAIDVYKSKPGKIDLVLLDLIMPEMGGKHCLLELRKINPEIRVVIASGYSVNGPTKDAIEAGAKGFISKPYDMKQVLEVVRKVLDLE